MNVSSTSINTKTSCSPDLGIESDGAATSSRPLQEASKISESMTNLLSDNEQQCRLQNVNNESPLPTEGGILIIIIIFYSICFSIVELIIGEL